MRPTRADENRCIGRDGTHITYYTAGEGRPVLLANGLAADRQVWRHQIEYLGDRYRFITWDYRSLHGGKRPVGMRDHALDALAVLDAQEATQVAVMGWSMGVSVALALRREAPTRAGSLVLIGGAASPARGCAVGEGLV